MLNNIGETLLFISFLAGLIGLYSYFVGIRKKSNLLVFIGTRSILAIFALLSISVLVLIYLLTTKDYSNAYVAKNISNDLSFIYSIAALWAGQEGSLLLWSWILSLYTLTIRFSKPFKSLLPSSESVSLFILSFFIFLIVFVESPFDTLDTIPLNGRGLNPILQNFYMAIHPLTLYIGYIALTIPFAFALGSIISKDKTDNWVLRSKNWTYFSWIFL